LPQSNSRSIKYRNDS